MAFETARTLTGAEAMRPAGRGPGGALVARLISFNGRAGRLEFWLVVAVTVAFGGLADTALQILVPLDEFGRPSLVAMAVSTLIWLAIAWAQSAVATRRMRDRGWDRAMILAWFVGPPLLLAAGLVFAPILLPAGVLLLWQCVECGFLPSRLPRIVDVAS